MKYKLAISFNFTKPMKIFKSFIILSLCLSIFVSCTQRNKINFGELQSGAMVSFIRDTTGDWGIEISGNAFPQLLNQKPVQIEVFKGDNNIIQLATGYQSVQKKENTLVGKANVSNESGAAFQIEDHWRISGDVLSLDRKVSVTGTENGAGFLSAIRLSTEPTIEWKDVNYFSPDVLYGDPTYDGETSPGGTLAYDAKCFSIREDAISAPLFGLSFKNGNWAAVLDLAPNGATTQAETTAPATTPVIDELIQFGALGAQEVTGGGVEFGFWMPGTTNEFVSGFGRTGNTTPTKVVRRRYNPVKDGFTQNYQVGFRLSKGESFNTMVRDAWRWAWESLKPQVTPIDIEVARQAMIDHLADHVLVVNDLAGVGFLYDAVTGNPGSYRRSSITRPAGLPVNTGPLTQQRRPGSSQGSSRWRYRKS